MEPAGIDKALAEIEQCVSYYKEEYVSALLRGTSTNAAQYSRIAGAYEQCHIIVCKALGRVSRYLDAA